MARGFLHCQNGFMDFFRLYVRIFVFVLSALGLYVLIGLQFSWFDEVWPSAGHFVREVLPLL
ncbi:MAG: hypothetical protein J0I98_18765 [Mesorhizobium sp.]|mgnify:CR=1 FL=1|nr:hypothetical protein [Mesorhizobium sp.]MBN9244830.1 hypothetical protein [Mesorhizobium sp.]